MPFDAEGWRFAVDWDGLRALLFHAPDGGVRLRDERMRDITAALPELAAISLDRTAVLDGVVVVLDAHGRPDLAALTGRIAQGGAVQKPRTVFLATDLLHLDDVPTLAWPLHRRLAALHETVGSTPRLQAPDDVAEDGCALASAAGERGLPAILARRADAPYHPGVASGERLRIALEPRDDLVVVGFAGTPARPTGLLLAEWVEGRLVATTRVEAAWPATQAAWLRRRLETLRTRRPALEAPPADGPPPTWLVPELTATVRHGGRSADGGLRFPVVLAVRDDRDPAWCIRRDAVPPPAACHRGAPGFRPTVLLTLPLGCS